MGRIIWSDEALDGLEEITTYVRDFSPAAAAALERRIIERAESLAEMPLRGRPLTRERRELSVMGTYLIRYIVVADEVRILSIRHAARRPEA